MKKRILYSMLGAVIATERGLKGGVELGERRGMAR